MRDTITEQIIASHLVKGKPAKGAEIGLRIDQTLTQDATGTLAYLAFESMGLPRVRVDCAVSYVDHNIIQTDSRNADDHLFLKSCAAKFGVIYSGPGNGVSHHIHRQRFGVPGNILLGSDSHTTTGGCLGMLAMGAGGMDVALAMAGMPYYITTPKTWGIYVDGKLQPWVSGKDVILELLRRYTCMAGVGAVMEFYGPGVANLDMSARATISNMAVDMGFTAGIFPSDAITRDYLRRNGRGHEWIELSQGSNPDWDKSVQLDLSGIEPLVACPSNPDNVRPAAELSAVAVQQVLLGSSCNGSYRDFMVASKIVEGKTISPGVDFEVNPGSRQTLVNVMMMGGARALIEAGGRVHEPGCLGCIGMGQAPATGTVSLRTFPRNFKGRSGAPDDLVYLCSPETAAASALTGRITDPRTSGTYPVFSTPEIYYFKREWLITPPADSTNEKIIRGPNIKPLPRFDALPESLSGEVLIKVGDNASTDIILPGGNRILPYRSNVPALADFIFNAIDPSFPARARKAGKGVVIGGENYGQGSSREHAAVVPRYLGVIAKIAKSFARIHKSNLINAGILPLTFANPQDYSAVTQGDRIEISDIRRHLMEKDDEIIILVNKKPIKTTLEISERQRMVLLAGGILNQAKQ
jgi:aconitate hydratase